MVTRVCPSDWLASNESNIEWHGRGGGRLEMELVYESLGSILGSSLLVIQHEGRGLGRIGEGLESLPSSSLSQLMLLLRRHRLIELLSSGEGWGDERQ
jgi:hypothetical protein